MNVQHDKQIHAQSERLKISVKISWWRKRGGHEETVFVMGDVRELFLRGVGSKRARFHVKTRLDSEGHGSSFRPLHSPSSSHSLGNPRLGLELFALSNERELFARQGFTTSYARVAEHIYRALLFHAPDDWELQLFSSKRWCHRDDEREAFQRHFGQVQSLFRPRSLPLVERWVCHPWREWLKRHRYIHAVRAERLSVLQYTSDWPWNNAPVVEREVALAADFFPERSDSRLLSETIERFRKRRESLWMIAISEFTRQDAMTVAQMPGGRVKALPLAVDHDVYRPDEQTEDRATLSRYDLPERYVFYAGSLSERKNVMTLVRAIEVYNLRREPAEAVALVLAGNVASANFRQRRRIWSQIRSLLKRTPIKQIAYPTDLDMAALYRGAQLVAHPSVFEGFGFTVLEALACGIPVICGRHSSLTEVGGPAARFVEDVHDIEELVAALDEVLDSPSLRQTMRSRGLTHAAGFQWDVFERQVVEVYGCILEGRDI